jgi:protein SCO1
LFLTRRLALLASIVFISGAIMVTACAHRSRELPKYDRVPRFTTIDSEGRPFTADELAGKVWIVDFIYTNCPAECPLMSSQMRKVSQQVSGEPDVGLLSISVDPARDTPPVLHQFAQKYGAPTKQWLFVTGKPETVHELAYNTFHVGDVIGKIEHSTKFVLVDKSATIRGYYSSFDPESIAQILKDAEFLRGEKS